MELSPIYKWVDEHADMCIEELREVIQQPSIAAQDIGVADCAELLASKMKAIGMQAVARGAGGQPFVLGKVESQAGDKTLVVYNHYDVQPPEPLDEWTHEPFAATIVDGRIIGRGATDSKGNLMSHLLAVRAYREVYGDVPLNVKYLFDGEEEIGSPTIDRFVSENRERLMADAALSLDGGFDASNRPRIQFGSSGLLYIEVRARGAKNDLHSARARLVENPAWKLVWVLASMKDRNEHILVDGFYDEVRGPTEAERALIEAYDWDQQKQLDNLGVSRFVRGVSGPDALERLLFQPTCNIAGIFSGYTGQGNKTVLPATATFKMDFRLVPEQDPDTVFERVKAHIESLGFDGVEVVRMGKGIPPSYAPLSSGIATAVIDAARAVYPQGPSLLPRGDASGKQGPWLGSQLDIPGVSTSVGPPDWHGHAPNEFMTIKHFLDGIKYVATIYANFAQSS